MSRALLFVIGTLAVLMCLAGASTCSVEFHVNRNELMAQ